MKAHTQISLLLLLLAFSLNAPAQTRGCGTMEYLEMQQQNDPDIVSQMNDAEAAAQQWLMQHGATHRSTGIITIPVVIHVVAKFQSQVPPLPRLLAQIDVLNDDFGAQNSDITKVPAVWTSAIANSGIQFCLARQDPQGNPTTGITYDTTTVTSFTQNDHVKFDSLGGCNAWDPTRYFNVWVCNLTSPLLGYAKFPSSFPSPTYGIVISYKVAGPHGNQLPAYNLGRTLTHEMGHAFGLRHIWGDDNGACNGTDYCGDTPNQGVESFGCPTFPMLDNCAIDSPGVMFMNYMDYSNDSCMYMFTNDQAARMQSYLNTTLSSLLGSPACLPVGIEDRMAPEVSIFPNPSNGRFEVGFNTIGDVEIAIFDALGTQIEFRKVHATGKTSVSFDPTMHPAGIYFISLVVDGITMTRKIMLQ
jgi:hypothetical protein